VTSLRIEVPTRDAASLEVVPDLDAARGLAGAYGHVPLTHTYVADCETPVSAFLKLRDGGPAFLLESAEQGQRVGRYSMLGVQPRAVLTARGETLREVRADGTGGDLDPTDPFGAVERAVAALAMAPASTELAFVGGAVGFFGYDLVRRLESLPDAPPDDRGLPDMVALITGPVIVFDHLRRSLTIIVPCRLGGADPTADYAAAVAEIAALKRRIAGPVPERQASAAPRVGPVASNVTQAQFETAVERAREYIFAGDAFQVVPSQRFTAETDLDPFSIYRGLRTVNPSPYMFFLELDDLTLVGSSPETLVKVTDGVVEMHPIAGSRPRGATPEADEALRAELLADPKERAEHVMLVDLGRNDVGRVSETGSVEVRELMAVQGYSHVMHIESTVVGTLAPGRSAVDALRATFPAGTLSGAPKVRAMEIIDELETTRRGPYGGAVGYLGYDGDLDTCITIRTLVCADGLVHAQAGAGVVADSVPENEHRECENKAAALFRAIEVAAGQVGW